MIRALLLVLGLGASGCSITHPTTQMREALLQKKEEARRLNAEQSRDARAFWAKRRADEQRAEEERTGIKRPERRELSTWGIRKIPPALLEPLLALRNPQADFTVSAWGDSNGYTVGDKILYHVKSSRPCHISLFWIGPDDAVILSVEDERVDAERETTLVSNQVIVKPVGRERWRVLATEQPLGLPASEEPAELLRWLDGVLGRGGWAVGEWETESREEPVPPDA